MNFADLKEKIVPLLKKNDVVNAAVFGSYARGEEKPSSDLDIVIKFREGKIKTLFDLIKLQQELENILRIKVDINTYDSLSPLIKKEVEREMRVII
ncbi:MAG: uncharacterized protein PWP45_1325 [Tepidanaerobacteraceae bacterium]|nr:uncharacterized protein [Tepidanaerobacteraceae bacterium]